MFNQPCAILHQSFEPEALNSALLRIAQPLHAKAYGLCDRLSGQEYENTSEASQPRSISYKEFVCVPELVTHSNKSQTQR